MPENQQIPRYFWTEEDIKALPVLPEPFIVFNPSIVLNSTFRLFRAGGELRLK